jgi:phytoene desaturase
MSNQVIVIGAGFAGLSAGTSLASKGYDVTVLEKNAEAGGRARVWRKDGFVFDMGPSWYWMPEVFEGWFNAHGSKVADHYDLRRLDPSYRVVHGPNDQWDLPAGVPQLKAFFDRIEPGAGEGLADLLAEAAIKYDLGMGELVRRPALSWGEFINARVISGFFKTSVFGSMRRHVRKRFKDPRLCALLEFPVLFLGSTPERTPALYSLMNHADMALGTWYPMGGMGRIVDGMVATAQRHGVRFQFDSPVERILVENGRVTGVLVNGSVVPAGMVVASADYHHVDTSLLAPAERSYSEGYWDSRALAPSSLLFYLGFDRVVPGLLHHTLFFDRSLDVHARQIHDAPQWPTDPLMYVCAPSKTDPSVAPAGCENVFVLMPIAPGLEDTEAIRERYFGLLIERLEQQAGIPLRPHLRVKRSYCIKDFQQDHNAYKGNAYGLANTLRQTAVLKPTMKSRRARGLYYAGQLTVPGPGVPPAIISGQVVASPRYEHARTIRPGLHHGKQIGDEHLQHLVQSGCTLIGQAAPRSDPCHLRLRALR